MLLVDKDEDMINAIGTYLSRRGYDVMTAEDGSTAISTIESVSPPLILSGAKLGDMDGIRLLRAVKEKRPDTEVIIMTDKDDIDTGIKSLKFDASDFICKPVSGEVLQIVLQRANKRISTRSKLKEYSEKLAVLRTNSSLFQQLFDEMPCYISVQNRKMRITGSNRQFKNDFGDEIGSHCYEVYKHRTDPCIDCPVEATFRDGKSHQTEEVVTTKSGEQYYVLTWTAPIRDSSGEIVQVMEMSTNVTQIRNLEDHLTSLGLLIGSMSHGIRGLLTALDGGIYRLELGIKHEDKEKIHGASEVIKQMVERIRSMVLNILYYAKERNLNWSRVNVLSFSNDVASLVEQKAKKQNIEFVRDFAESMTEFEIDPGIVTSALVNILENAIDACVDDRSENKVHRVTFGLREDEDSIIFDILDNGIGMDRETRENMFTLFFSSKGHRGTGLGLFISNQIIDQHGGSIKVDSTLGQGSHFTISLPKSSSATAKEIQKQEGEGFGAVGSKVNMK